jgi:2-methylisocitrate lyase-like PEP mutase family enzyme
VTPSRRLRELLAGKCVHAALIYDGLSARVAELLGFDALYLSGSGVSAALGLPDVGLTTMTEMLHAARAVTFVTSIPVLCDADTGYGNAVNVQRTVREYERAGAAGIHLEDQEFPKKCGFFAGKRIIPAEEHASKIAAACDARSDPDFVVIGRTDALAVDGWDGVIERVKLYLQAGSDLIMVDGVRQGDIDEYTHRVVSEGIPCVLTGDALPIDEVGRRGFKLKVSPAAIFGAYEGMWRALNTAMGNGTEAREIPMREDVLGLEAIYDVEAKFAMRPKPESTRVQF